MRKYFKLEIKMKAYHIKIAGDAVKVVLRGKFTATNFYNRKEKYEITLETIPP